MNNQLPVFKTEEERRVWALARARDWVATLDPLLVDQWGEMNLIMDRQHELLLEIPMSQELKGKMGPGSKPKQQKPSLKDKSPQEIIDLIEEASLRDSVMTIKPTGKNNPGKVNLAKAKPAPSLIGKSAQELGREMAAAMVANLRRQGKNPA